MLWDPFLYCINDSIQGNSETGNKVFVLPSKVAINNLQLSDDILILDNSAEQIILQKEQQRIIKKTLNQLKPLDWKIFVAYYYQYKKVDEIAREFQMNPQTVKTRMRRGKELLKKILIKEGYGVNED